MIGEDAIVHWLRTQSVDGDTGLIGDDAAILPESEPWAITTDCQIADVHFPADLAPPLIARRLLAVNLSDLAAMGAQPTYAFLALAAPQDFAHQEFLSALLAACRDVGLSLAGGDLARSKILTANLTLLGKQQPGGRWLRRGGARPGHSLWISGSLGQAAAGLSLVLQGARIEDSHLSLPKNFHALPEVLNAAKAALRRHLQPRPQLILGAWLATTPEGAAIDVSDGLAKDLHRLCRESKVGAMIELERLPTAKHHRQLLEHLNLQPTDNLLAGGEDYVLLFSLPKGLAPPAYFGCTEIGRVLREQKILLRENGNLRPLEALGWDHLEPQS